LDKTLGRQLALVIDASRVIQWSFKCHSKVIR
jgi:hypothetical protein